MFKFILYYFIDGASQVALVVKKTHLPMQET